MSKKLLSSLAAALVLSAGAAQAAVINFDGFAAGSTQAVGTFDALGVRFNEALYICGGTCGDLPSSAPNTAINGESYGGNITGYFLGPVTSVDFISVVAGDNGGDTDTVTLRGYDASDTLVGSASFTGTTAQTLSISGAGIVRFEIIQSGLIAIDDFTFNPSAAVPAPAPLALVGAALLGMGFTRRRRG
jgi:hypothetical protein